MTVVQGLVAAVVGAMVGSFANVVIYRVPRRESVVAPRSRCPACGHPIAARDNVPLLSFLLLRGRCRHCGTAISWRYPLVEALTALLFVAVWRAFGPTWEGLRAALFVLILVVVVFVDLDHRLIPNAVTYPGMTAGLLLALPDGPAALAERVLAGVGAGAFFLAVAVVSRGGMGGGDVKLAAVMGLFLGWPAIAAALFLSFLAGGLVGIALILLRLRRRKDAIPFGPFLALGSLAGLFWGASLVRWYFG